jgi:SAM-dependent methyltransferase
MTQRPEVAWSALAPKWDTSGAPWNQPVAHRLIELARLKPGMVTADMGCGAGAVTIPAARIVDPASVTGIDTSAAMITRARQRAEADGISNVMFLCGDAAEPELEPGTYDAVLSSMVMVYLRHRALALSAWRELLRPGGVLAFSWVMAEDKKWKPAYGAVDAFLPPQNQWASYRPNWAVPEVEAMLPPGMEISTITEAVTTRFDSMEHWWASSLTQAPALAWSQLPASDRDDAKRNAFAVLEGLQANDGSLERTRTVCYTIAHAAGGRA